MSGMEKLKIVYDFHKGSSKNFVDFDTWVSQTVTKDWYLNKFDFEYDLAIYQKNNTTRFHRMILDDEYTLIKNGIPESTIDEILSSSVYPCDMNSEILKMIFVIESLRLFGLFDYDIKFNRIKTIGGGFQNNGPTYGYIITINDNEVYTIELDKLNCELLEEGEVLLFGDTTNKQILKKEVDMLSRFSRFNNSLPIEETIEVLDKKLDNIKNNTL